MAKTAGYGQGGTRRVRGILDQRADSDRDTRSRDTAPLAMRCTEAQNSQDIQ